MLSAIAAACPSSMPLVTNGPFPWQCIPVWNRECIAEAKAQPGSCVISTFGPGHIPDFGAASWWTLPHIAAIGMGAIVAAVIIGLCLALSRDNFRASRAARR